MKEKCKSNMEINNKDNECESIFKNQLSELVSTAFSELNTKLDRGVDLCAALAETSSGVNSQDMTKNSPKTDEMNKEENMEDDMKGAIEWAKHQKQSLLNKK